MVFRGVFGWVTVAMMSLIAGGCAMGEAKMSVSKADALPRKVVVATVMQRFRGPLEERLKQTVDVIADAGKEAAAKQPGKRLDLVVLPEYGIATENGGAVKLEEVQAPLASAVKKIGAYVIVCGVFQEKDRVSNAAVLFDRSGNVMGIYRKVHTVVDEKGAIECGAKPGTEYPVFDCDFGKLGIQICWDMSYPEGWDALKRKGAEIVASPSASPATIRLAAHAQRNGFWVVSSTVRDNVTVFYPTGMVAAQSTDKRVLVCEIDLSFAMLGWSETLEDGEGMKKKFGDKVGYVYSPREDVGVFWSNDPKKSIGEMYREMGLREITVDVAESERVNDQVRGGKAR